MNRERAEKILALLALSVPPFSQSIQDTSGKSITKQDVAAALATASELAYLVATYKYADGDGHMLMRRLWHNAIARESQNRIKREKGFYERLTWMALADTTASRICRVCNGQGIHTPTATECQSCRGKGLRMVKERERWRHMNLNRNQWEGGVKRIYTDILREILEADGEAIEKIKSKFG